MNDSPFQLAAPALRANGYSVIPLNPGQKYPVINGWSEYCSRLPSDEEHARWMEWKSSNLGLCLGPASGVMALDFDDDVDGLHAGILAVIPESPVRKRGAKGFTAFYRYGGERSQGHNAKGVRVLDVLAGGKQTVLPPSVHPSGAAYEWITPLTLADIPADRLPEIPATSMQVINGLFRPEPARPVRAAYHEPYRGSDAAEIAEALAYVPADDHDLWIRMGMALRQHLGERGLPIWDAWSATSPKYDAAEIPRRWRSFRRNDVTISSLFYAAMDHGYIHRHRLTERPTGHTLTIEHGGDLMPHRDREGHRHVDAARPTAPPGADTPGAAEILDAPGLVGRIAGWINETSLYPQPRLALAASIALAGVALAHKVQSPTRLRTNFYALGLAPSGAGKDHARDCVNILLDRAGMEGLLGGTPASGAGMLTALREGGGRCLILWDEFGRVLKNLTHKNAGSHQRDILTYLVELFSSARSLYAGVQYANHDGKMKRTPIEQPCLSVYATTVPERFFQSLTSDDAIDGFLARWLVLESEDYTLTPARVTADVTEPPEALLEELRRWREAPSNYDPKGNMDGILRIRPMTVSYSAEAARLIDDYSLAMRKKAAESAAARSGLSAIYARCAEHAIKLALASHEGESIGAGAMAWGIAVAGHCAAYLVEALRQNVAENDHERGMNRVLKVIAGGGGGWVENRVLIARTRNMKLKDRTEVIGALLECGDIEREEVPTTTKPAWRYRISARSASE